MLLTGEDHGACGYLNVCGGWSSQSRWVRFQSKFLPHWLMISIHRSCRLRSAQSGRCWSVDRGFAHRQPLVDVSDRCDRSRRCRARAPRDRVLQAQVVHRRRWGRAASLGTMVRDWCLGLRGMLGSMCFIGFAFTDDPLCHLLLGADAVGYAAGATARISSRPWIAIACVSFILLPVSVGSALRGGWSTWRWRD